MTTSNPDYKPNFLVDLDGTLAIYTDWQGYAHIGEPIAPMVNRVKNFIAEGKDVRIFTARIFPLTQFENVNTLILAKREPATPEEETVAAGFAIRTWCMEQFGQILPITCRKDRFAVEIFDDRAVQIVPNRGVSIETWIGFHMNRVLAAAGVEGKDGESYAQFADRGALQLRKITKAFEDSLAFVDGAGDALTYIKGENPDDDRRNFTHARGNVSRAVAILRAAIEA